MKIPLDRGNILAYYIGKNITKHTLTEGSTMKTHKELVALLGTEVDGELFTFNSMRKYRRWYVGCAGINRHAFALCGTPDQGRFPHFNAVVGPFRTKRGAMYAAKHGLNNPHILSVSDAEYFAKITK